MRTAISTTGGNILLRLRMYPEYSDYTSNQMPLTGDNPIAWTSVHNNAYVEYTINDNVDPSRTMTSTGSRIVGQSCFSNNMDSKIDTVERELFLRTGVEQATEADTKTDVVLVTAQRLGGTGTEKVHASIMWSQML